MNNKEKITIIGGGYAGCISAIMLAKAGYQNITILESGKNILDGASKVAGRLHCGGEYPKDEKTARACLDSSILFKLYMPNIYTDVPNVIYPVSSISHESGELTIETVIEQYKKIQQRYAKYLQDSNINNTEERLFGRSKDFLRVLSPDELSHLNGFIGGIETKEKGINPLIMGTFLEGMLDKYGINVLTKQKVTSITKNNHEYTIYTNSDNVKLEFNTSQIINTSWESVYGLERSYLGDKLANKNKVQIFLRGIAIIDISKCQNIPRQAVLGLIGENGGMLSPFNDKKALGYLPSKKGAYIDSYNLRPKKSFIPDNWQSYINENLDVSNREDEVLLKLTERYPFLEAASVDKLVIRTTLSYDKKIYRRRDSGVKSLDDGYISATPAKATYAIKTSLQIVENVMKNSLQKGTCLESDIIIKESEGLVVYSEFDMSNELKVNQEFAENVVNYAKKRNIPPLIAKRGDLNIKSSLSIE